MHAMEYYSVIKRMEYVICRNMDDYVEMVIRDYQGKYHMISFTCEVTKKIHMYLF